MNKSLSIIVKETKEKLAKICNESGLSPVILDLIVQGIYLEIHNLAEKQTSYDEKTYLESLKNKDINEFNDDMDD